MIHPTRAKKFAEANGVLDDLGFETASLTAEIADRMRVLQASYGNKNIPLVDAAVVALGVEHGFRVVTLDGTWPDVTEAEIEVLTRA